MSKGASDFKKIPYVGEATEADLLALGYEDIASLKGADPDETKERTKALGRGRCIIYVYRGQLLRKHSAPRQSQAKVVALEGLNLRI
ncbi:putative protein, possible virulence protein [Campylobacter gracilis]|uniref:Pathogenicity locus n=1 Tax=Campylobacter gracilis RM3268 TaxID=553220 RepID=C8PHZ7_9BACT|nr:putative protein, possible virulence protein [Campylobacter gracilis]EEV17761.1 hypothetical protein CAMGR0001_0593 [Campylobacter gracilis RM3268]SUW78482.1 Pathogenicity locus [Campylobacter gracilis]